MPHPDPVPISHHVPSKVAQPVGDGLHPTDELQMLGLADPLLDEEEHKAGWDEGHGEDHADGDQHVHRCGHPAAEGELAGSGEPTGAQTQHSQCSLRELLLGEVQGVVDGRDAIECGVRACRQLCPQQPIVGHVEEGDHGVPALVVEPHLQPESAHWALLPFPLPARGTAPHTREGTQPVPRVPMPPALSSP